MDDFSVQPKMRTIPFWVILHTYSKENYEGR